MYDERKLYNFRTPGYSESTGHFTQIVWKGSKKVGIGLAKSKNGMYYGVASYYPPGNLQGTFEENVLPINDDEYKLAIM